MWKKYTVKIQIWFSFTVEILYLFYVSQDADIATHIEHYNVSADSQAV